MKSNFRIAMATHPKPSLHTSPNKRIKTLDAKSYPPPQSPSSFVSRGKSKIHDGTTSVPIKKEVKNEPADCSGICLPEYDNGGASRGCSDRTSIPIKKEVKNEPADCFGIFSSESENSGASRGYTDRTSIPIKKEVKNEPADCSGICLSKSDYGGVSGGYIGRTSIPIKKEVKNELADCCGICLSESDNSGVSRGTSIPIKKEVKNESESDNSGVSRGCIDRTSNPIKEEVKNEAADCCGICLLESDNGRASRGYIDSCNHYFCFFCIMEWAKVESKCPFCKRRFSTIRRPPKPPIFASERVVRVPVRNQVYRYSGSETNGPPDPYREVKCSVCHGVEDENLLLLCDICDAASHTYCVGLGSTVPEGDWFCQDCTLLRDEHLESETHTDSDTNSDTDSDTDTDTDTDSGSDISLDTVHRLSSANKHVSIFDIVREPSSLAPQRPRSASLYPWYLSRTSSAGDRTSMIKNMDRPGSTSSEIVTQHRTHPNARTLQHCRNLNDRIRILRENWSGFRNGILQFSSPCGNISCQKSSTRKTRRHSVSCLNQQSEVQCSSSDITNDVGSHDIHKAWKMMDKAKSIKQGRERSTSVRQASECPWRKLNALENAEYMSYRHLSPDSRQIGSKNVGSIGQGNHNYHSLTKDSYKQEQKCRRHITEDVRNCCKGSVTGHSPTSYGLRSSKAVPTPPYPYDASVRSQKLPTEESFKRPACSSSSAMSESIVLNGDHVKGANHTSSSYSKVQHSKEKSELEKICVDRQRYNDAKSEIRSLVKLNLKLQTKEEKLGVDAFKEIARLATHSILAACGLEHPKPGFCSVPGFICSHSNEVRLLQISSSLMPNSCRECFYVFVKDMVNIVMLQKKRTQKKT